MSGNTDVDRAKWESLPNFKVMSSNFAENENTTKLALQSSRQGAADTINHNRAVLAYAIHNRDMKLCELSHWTIGRMFRDSSTDDPPTDHNHNCEVLDYTRPIGETASITYSPGFGEEEITKTYTDLGGGRTRVNAKHPKVTAAGIEAGSYSWCSTRPCIEDDVYDYNKSFQAKIDALDGEAAMLEHAITYEKDQRRNLEELRDEKGIEDWHLEVIYTDREETRSETNPSSEGGQKYINKKAAVPYIWLGVITTVAIGAVFVGREVRDYRIAKKGPS